MRPHHARSPFHSLRAAVVATSIVTLAASAHVLGGGRLPATGIMMAVLSLTGLAATAATRFRLSFPAMTAVLGSGQIVLHWIFTALSGAVPAAAGTPPLHHVGSGVLPAVHVDALLADAVPLDAVPLDAMQLHPMDSPAAALMVIAHSLATFGTALLLAKGEAALWALAVWLRPLIRLPETAKPDAVTAAAVTGQPAAATARPWRNLRQDSRRGPPSAVVLL